MFKFNLSYAFLGTFDPPPPPPPPPPIVILHFLAYNNDTSITFTSCQSTLVITIIIFVISVSPPFFFIFFTLFAKSPNVVFIETVCFYSNASMTYVPMVSFMGRNRNHCKDLAWRVYSSVVSS